MYVLTDVEWVQEKSSEKQITQIAASRVDGNWTSTADISCLVRPRDEWDRDLTHMAFSGYSPDEFAVGCTELEGINELHAFIRDDDILIVWSKETKKILMEKYELYRGVLLSNNIVCANEKIYDLAKRRGMKVFEMYAVAEAAGIETPAPKHCSVNDVLVLKSLLAEFKYTPEKPVEAHVPPPKKTKTRAERNADILSRVQYNYVFTPTSAVFHRPDCKLMLRASGIMGCIYYETAEKSRRPCKMCHPDLGERILLSEAKKAKSPPSPANKQVVVAKMLGNQKIQIATTKIVGCCHNSIHPGKLTAKLMEQHDCLGKQCRFFEKYGESYYWQEQERKIKEKSERKAEQRRRKQEVQLLEKELAEKKELFQSYADAFEPDMLIVRLQKESKNRYKVFYVSENRFADGNRFPEFLRSVRYHFPGCQIELRHIRDVDRHFVTIDEYIGRRGFGA